MVHRRFPGRALLALITLVGSTALAVVPAGSAPLAPGIIGGFEQDGNQAVNGGTGALDWANQALAPAGTFTVIADDTADSGFTEGSKELKPTGWVCGTGGAEPGKADILAAYVNPRVSGSGVFLDLGFVRRLGEEAGGKGDVHVNFEFNQAQVGVPGPFAVGPCGIARAVGDLLVTYDFPGGSDAPSIEVYRWSDQGQGNDEGDWLSSGIAANKVAGAVNGSPINDPRFGDLSIQRFGEASLDLTDILRPPGQAARCVAFGSANVRSRSSGESWTSMLQDKLPAWPVDFSTCGSIRLVKRTDGGAPLAGAAFKLFGDTDSNGLDGSDPQVGATCVTDALGRCGWTDLNPGRYFVAEITPPAGYSLDDDPVVGPIVLDALEHLIIDGTTDVDGDQVADGFVDYQWRYALSLTPDATNLVGTDHVFVATLTVQKSASGPSVPAPGATLDLALTGEGTIVSPGSSCVTNASGQCAITIHSDSAGDSTLAAAYDDTITTASVDAADSAVKHWINYRIGIGPDATNRVGSTHVFTVLLERDSGSGFGPVEGAHPTLLRLSGPGSLAADGCATTGTDEHGECTIELSSAVTGTSIVQARYDAVEETTSNTFSASATKHWVDYDLTVNPDGVNHAGDPHMFTVHLAERTGETWHGLAGETVGLSWTGSAGSGIDAASCVTDEAGDCTVTATSATAGQGVLGASWDSEALESGVVHLSDDAAKRWLDWDIAIAPSGRTNLVGSDHEFTVTLRFDDGQGGGWAPLAGAIPTIGLTGEGSVTGGTCATGPGETGTAENGTCTVVITSADPGGSEVTASYEGVDADSEVSESLSATADKHWVDFAITVEPDAVNRVGDDHVFTVTLSRDSGDGFAPLADAPVELSWNGPGGSVISAVAPVGSIPLSTCTTDGDGQCLVTVSSSVAVTGTLTATYAVALDSGSYRFSGDSTKRWVDWGLSITPPDAENLVGTDHTFTVLVVHDAGDGNGRQPLAGAVPVITLAGPGAIKAQTCAAGTAAGGTCTVTITSTDPGSATVTAAFSAEEGQASANLVAGARKLWVDYRIAVTPKTAVNPVGTTHTLTVTLEKNTGLRFRPAPGETVNLGLTGLGSIIGVDAGSIGTSTTAVCTTDVVGTCRVTITSSQPGLSTLGASYGAVVGSTSRTFTDEGHKTWEEPVVVLGAVEEPPTTTTTTPPVVQPATELPRTGGRIGDWLLIGVALLTSGLTFRQAGRRRKRSAAVWGG